MPHFYSNWYSRTQSKSNNTFCISIPIMYSRCFKRLTQLLSYLTHTRVLHSCVGLMVSKACWNEMKWLLCASTCYCLHNLSCVMAITPFVSVIIIDSTKKRVIKQSTFISHRDVNTKVGQSYMCVCWVDDNGNKNQNEEQTWKTVKELSVFGLCPLLPCCPSWHSWGAG